MENYWFVLYEVVGDPCLLELNKVSIMVCILRKLNRYHEIVNT